MALPPEVDAKVRSLKAELAGAGTPEKRLPLLLQLADALRIVAPNEARPFLEQAISEASETGADEAFARASNMLAGIHRMAGDVAASRRCVEQALAMARKIGDRRLELSALNNLGLLHEMAGETDRARELFQHCLQLSRAIGFKAGEEAALNQLGCQAAAQGLPEAALEFYRQFLELVTRSGDARGRATAYYNISTALVQTGRWEEAVENAYRAIALSEEHGFWDLRLGATDILGEIFLNRDRLARAAELFNSVIDAERKQPMYQMLLISALTHLGQTRFRLDDTAGAEQNYAEALQLTESANERGARTGVLCALAELAIAQGRFDLSRELLEEASHLADELKQGAEQGETLRLGALLRAKQGAGDEADRLFRRALEVTEGVRSGYELGLVQLQYGRFLLEADRRAEAVPLLQSAARTFHRLSVVAESEEANRLLVKAEEPGVGMGGGLKGISGLTRIGLEPTAFLERSLDLLAGSLEFDSGVVMLAGQPVAIRGRPDLAAAAGLVRAGLPAGSRTALFIPVRPGPRIAGGVYLERKNPGPEPDLRGTAEIASLLAGPLRRLAALPLRPHKEIEIPGLVYRGMIGRSPEMLDNLGKVARIAGAPIPVLIYGETGTGKELVALALHESGSRQGLPFVAVNCAAVPEALLEAEFFGVERGAATGVTARKGKFELATGGTIFLDEVADMSLPLQGKLLRVLQERSLEPIGGARQVAIDVRVVAATNQDLETLMAAGRFRRDLYYRLCGIELRLPPLRKRREDIPDFVRYFVARSTQEFSRSVTGVSPDALARLSELDWPGNIRQLQHAVERAVILAEHPILSLSDLVPTAVAAQPPGPAPVDPGPRSGVAPTGDQRSRIIECLTQAKWNVSRAAELAGFSRAQFYRLMRKYGISRPD